MWAYVGQVHVLYFSKYQHNLISSCLRLRKCYFLLTYHVSVELSTVWNWAFGERGANSTFNHVQDFPLVLCHFYQHTYLFLSAIIFMFLKLVSYSYFYNILFSKFDFITLFFLTKILLFLDLSLNHLTKFIAMYSLKKVKEGLWGSVNIIFSDLDSGYIGVSVVIVHWTVYLCFLYFFYEFYFIIKKYLNKK